MREKKHASGETKERKQQTTVPKRGTALGGANRAWLLLVFLHTMSQEEEVIIKMFRDVKQRE